MSISMKSSKMQMYSEIERLRALLDVRDAGIRLQAETIERRDATIDELTTQLQGRAQQTAARGDRATRMLIAKRLAVTLKSTVRWNDERGFEYMNDGHWSIVPSHTLTFVTSGTQS
jgi:hypothetical protein